jgi:ribosomal protein L37E
MNLKMVYCKRCGMPIGYTQKRVCTECIKLYHKEKAKKWTDDKEIVRSVIYKSDRDNLKALAHKHNMAIYDYLHIMIEKEFALEIGGKV